MKRWNECLNEANVPTEYPSRATPTHEWMFYSNGSLVLRGSSNLFDAIELAKLKKLYPAHEKIKLVDDAYDMQVSAYNAATARAGEIWDAALRSEYSHLPVKIYNICFETAYERGHSSGYDEVANCMIGVVDFAASIIEAWSTK